MMRVVGGKLITHICMKIRNWSRFMMFHRYLSPIAKKICKIIRPIVAPAIDEATLSLTDSSAAISA